MDEVGQAQVPVSLPGKIHKYVHTSQDLCLIQGPKITSGNGLCMSFSSVPLIHLQNSSS